MYTLNTGPLRDYYEVTVVGCGGTGGHVAEGLCRILPPNATLVLIDHDQVEERNLIRQNFTRDEIGCFKSEALARRLAKRYSRPVSYSILPIVYAGRFTPGLVIGCVDNGLARSEIAKKGSRNDLRWWVDAGNGESYGQVIIGNTDKDLRHIFDAEKNLCYGLPLPTIQRPELLLQAPRRRDCSDIDQEQGPTINMAMAALVLEVVRRLIEGTCSWMQLYLDLEAGTLSPVLATPEAVARMTGISRRKLVKERR